jgi:hypothetical protein
MPKAPQRPDPVAYTPTRADASVITSGKRDDVAGLAAVTNNRAGKLQQRAATGKTVTTGGTI